MPRAVDSSQALPGGAGRRVGSPDEPTFGVGQRGGTDDCPGLDGNEDVSAFAEVDEGNRAGCPEPPLTH